MMIAVLGDQDKTIDADDVASAIERGECVEVFFADKSHFLGQ